MTPSEFDATCRRLESACPKLNATSGYRSAERNAEVNGAEGSKHLLGMARDYSAASIEYLQEASRIARGFGLWVAVHDKGSGIHLHIQGLAPGDPPGWWIEYVNRGKASGG